MRLRWNMRATTNRPDTHTPSDHPHATTVTRAVQFGRLPSAPLLALNVYMQLVLVHQPPSVNEHPTSNGSFFTCTRAVVLA
jgi:hypothetical protein